MTTKRRLVIVGAGLGGCFLADKLAEAWDVTIVELGTDSRLELQQRIRDTDRAAVTHPHVGCGLGGTTSVWHNGLIEVDEALFRQKWPFPKKDLAPYYEAAFQPLADVPKSVVEAGAAVLRERMTAIGMPDELLGQELYYPRRRINAWHRLKLSKRVKVFKGEVVSLVPAGEETIDHLVVQVGGESHKLDADVFVLAAGGLGTPLLLQRLAERLPLPGLRQAGFNYEDHPSAFVGEVTLARPLYKLWNYPVPKASGSLRLPMVVEQDGLKVSFQLRPGSYFRFGPPRNRVVSVLNDLRNQPFNWRSYFKLLNHWDDVFEILSFKFGVHLPTRTYSLLIVAEQPSSETCAVWRENNGLAIYRKWTTPPTYIDSLNKAIHRSLDMLSDIVVQARVFDNWPDAIFSSSHHSGTARMSTSPSSGVCDGNGRVYGITNLYVCDGSAIPASGHANTGLTIAALALRLADHLNEAGGR